VRAVRARRPGWRSRRSRCWSCPWSRIDRRVGVPAGGAAARTERQDAAPVFGFEMFVRCFRRRAARRRCWSWSRPPWLSRRVWAIAALVGPTLSRIPNGNGPVRGQLSAWVGTALSRFPSGNGPARGQPAAWVGPTLSRIPRGNRPARGQPAACGLLGRSDAVSGPLWTRASEGTAAGTSLASSGVSYRRRRCELSAPRTSFWSPFARFSHDSVRKAPPRRGDCGRRP
jgi:hypothetical protein